MIDVHAPHESVQGWRDFFIHIITITIGLLIALGLEGTLEWMHHRHLVHEAGTSLHSEIEKNSKDISDAIADVHQRQAELKNDIVVLNYFINRKQKPASTTMSIGFHIKTVGDVNWKTAQSTGALSYMSYAQAQEYSDIYDTQAELNAAQLQAARDAIISMAPFASASDNAPDPTPAEAADIKQKVEVLYGQLFLVDNLMASLQRQYQRFLSAHPA
jgi:hypothetical protein